MMEPTLFDEMSEPVQELFLLGVEAARVRPWPDYLAFGITPEHIPELIRIVRHFQSFWYDEIYDDDQGLTPIYAWRVLGQLQAQKAINALIFLVHENEEYDSDWVGEEIPVIMGMIGPACIPALKAYLNTPEKNLSASISAAECLEKVGSQHPDSRADCVAVLQHALEDFLENDETLNAFLISFLTDLKAVEAVPLVERAFQSGNVDISVMGDFEDFQIKMGLLEERLTPPLKYRWMKDSDREWQAYRESQHKFEQFSRQFTEEGEKEVEQTKKTRRRRRRKKGK